MTITLLQLQLLLEHYIIHKHGFSTYAQVHVYNNIRNIIGIYFQVRTSSVVSNNTSAWLLDIIMYDYQKQLEAYPGHSTVW